MQVNIDYHSKLKSRIYLILIILSFLGPLILATIMYKYSNYFSIAGPKTHGELLSPNLQINDFLKDSNKKILGQRKWIFLYVIKGVECKTSCKEKLHTLNQVRMTLGKNRGRVINILASYFEDTSDTDNIYKKQELIKKELNEKYSDFHYIKINNLKKNLKEHTLYLIDPLGNIFMNYDNFDAKGLQKDIKKVLKASRIG
ncbi:MAG: hypothetical protein CMD90_00480 [Gammaproteobacteria bacterium]|nr:hypothetical protein [Gammaproteobacteria bacterium]|tara:strand:+ start:6884 stop:7483 length:600 start_codon:yes stop_codon:yes gene_type:complete